MPRKQKLTHQEFCLLRDRAPLEVNSREAGRLVNDAALAIARLARDNPRIAYAWSGGKDSVVLDLVARMAGVKHCMLGLCDLEYPAFLRWVQEHGPLGLEIVKVPGVDYGWLVAHPQMLFPASSRLGAIWYRTVQHAAQAAYFRQRRLDVLLLGRRLQDGNFCGPAAAGYDYTTRGVRRVMPLANWTHTQVFAIIHHFGLGLAPFYGWPRGFRCGTHPWARRACPTIAQGWREVAAIDRGIVEQAAGFLPSARDYLKEAR